MSSYSKISNMVRPIYDMHDIYDNMIMVLINYPTLLHLTELNLNIVYQLSIGIQIFMNFNCIKINGKNFLIKNERIFIRVQLIYVFAIYIKRNDLLQCCIKYHVFCEFSIVLFL